MDNARLIRRITPVLEKFDTLDLTNKLIITGLNAVVMVALKDELNDTSFDCDILFNHDYAPYLKVTWWQKMTGDGDTITFRFKPFHVETNKSNLIAAYDRAMKIL